ncbi:MAG: RusA family crossover junction endodeoxyribonuclease [Clostridiaceae bacterium]
MADYAKVVIPGTPISKSNFKMVNKQGRMFMPSNSGGYNDRYMIYETTIALTARTQNPGIVFTESLIAILKVFYKSEKRHPDTNNITKSIFDGIEKSGLIINDAQITRLVIEEYYDKVNPRFELELYKESVFNLDFTVFKREEKLTPLSYELPSNKKGKERKLKELSASTQNLTGEPVKEKKVPATGKLCEVCKKKLSKGNYISGNGGKTLICRDCFSKLI